MVARATGDLAASLDTTYDESYEHRPSWNITPTVRVPIVIETLVGDEIVRRLGQARWGLLPHWAKDDKLSYKTFNVRWCAGPLWRSDLPMRNAVAGLVVQGHYPLHHYSVG